MLDWKYTPKAKQVQQTEETPELTINIKEETPEGFASKNAKTITFVVMLVLFLMFLGPISVFTIYRQMTDVREYDGEVMTESDLIELGKLGDGLSTAHIRRYARSESESKGRRTYIVDLDDYILRILEDTASKQLSVCLLTDRETGDNIDIRFENVEAFLSSH